LAQPVPFGTKHLTPKLRQGAMLIYFTILISVNRNFGIGWGRKKQQKCLHFAKIRHARKQNIQKTRNLEGDKIKLNHCIVDIISNIVKYYKMVFQ
jgi:hypothetical protein